MPRAKPCILRRVIYRDTCMASEGGRAGCREQEGPCEKQNSTSSSSSLSKQPVNSITHSQPVLQSIIYSPEVAMPCQGSPAVDLLPNGISDSPVDGATGDDSDSVITIKSSSTKGYLNRDTEMRMKSLVDSQLVRRDNSVLSSESAVLCTSA